MDQNKRLSYLAYASLILLILSIILLYVPDIDITTSDYFLSIQTDFGMSLASFFSFLASTIFLSIFSVLLVVFFYKKYKTEIKFFLVTLIGGTLVQWSLKYVFNRQRPINLIETNPSFPSGHAAASVLAYGALVYLFWGRKRWVSYLLMPLPIIICITRLYLNVHWLSDVIFGVSIGLLCLYISICYKDLYTK